MKISGMVADIQRCSTHDGPGIRTTVFLKGCNLRCAWCHNPETINPKQEWIYYPEKCISCNMCEEGCYSGARVQCGKEMSVEEVMRTVLLDQPYYANDGGLTISGGEPLIQPTYTLELLKAAKSKGIHVAIETNLTLPWNITDPIVEVCDLVMLDIKLWQEDLHRRWTSKDNKNVISNFMELAKRNIPIIVRTPIIPTVNDYEEEIKNIAKLVADNKNVLYYEMLPYHPLGQSKRLGENAFQTTKFERPELSNLQRLAAVAKVYTNNVRIAGKEV